jgi:Dullard-like phosphatase family protein
MLKAQQRSNASSSGPVTPGQRGQYSANATTPGTGQLLPRQPVTGQNAGARPTTPRRLSPINTSANNKGVDPNTFKGTLSPKATGGKSTTFSSNKGSLSPKGRGPSPRSRIKKGTATSSSSSSTSSTSSSGTSLNRAQRPAPISTKSKWTRNSPAVTSTTVSSNGAGQQSDDTTTIGIEEMRAQRRVLRLAAQLPEQLLGSSAANNAPAPLNLSKNNGSGSSAKKNSSSSSSGQTKKHKVQSSRAQRQSGQGASTTTSNGLKPLIVVLDLDETLVHSTFHGSGARMYRQIEKRKSKIRRQCESFSLTLDDGDRVTVNKRPQVDEFMRALQSPEFEPHVFTAALASYASPVMDRLEADQGRKLFKRRMYRDSCTPTGMGTFAKDLSTLYGDLSRVVLVDNNPISLMKQPSNGILVPSFFDDPNDDVLPTVLDFLRSLADAPDVRPVLRALKSDS